MEQSLTNDTIPNRYICVHCGEVMGKIKRMYCDFCTTAEKRREITRQNIEIQKENLEKGYYGKQYDLSNAN